MPIADTAATRATYSETFTYATINVTSTPVLAAPIWTSDTVDTLYNGNAFNIIYREYDYYYIQYLASDNVTKRGYISRSATNTVVTTWCQYDRYQAAYNNTSFSQPVYHTFYEGSGVSGTIYANNEICSSACGAGLTCNISHHKGAARLMNIAPSSDYYTMRYVGHTICWYNKESEEHKIVNGLGSLGGNKTIVNASNSGYSNTVLHELTHNLGASHVACDQD